MGGLGVNLLKCASDGSNYPIETHLTERTKRALSKRRCHELRPMFLYRNKESIERTLEATAQHGRTSLSAPNVKQPCKPPFPACNVRRRHESVSTDAAFSKTPAIGTNGAKKAIIFVGRESMFISIYGVISKEQFPNALMDVIRHHGAMDQLTSDSEQALISNAVNEILTTSGIFTACPLSL